MRVGRIKAKANDYAIAAMIHTGKPISPDMFLSPALRSPAPPKDAAYYEGRARNLGLTKTDNY